MHPIQTLNDTSWLPKWTETDLFSKLNREQLKKVMEASKRVHRWGNFALTDEVITKITSLVDRNRAPNETVEDLLERILDEFLHIDWNEYLDETGRVVGGLPDDGNVYDHSKWQTAIIKKYWKLDVKWLYISESEYIVLKILALIHDIGEIGLWDILYGDKSEDKEIIEQKLGEVLLFSLFKGGVLSSSEEKLLERIYEINFDKEHPLYKIFTNYEKLSYMQWAISAYKNRKQINKPIALIHNVLGNQIKPLLSRWLSVPAIESFLKFHSNDIDIMFDYVDNSWFQNDSEERNSMYEEAKELWQDSKFKN